MKQLMMMLFIALAFVLPCNAQFFADNFEYPAGDTLSHYWITRSPLGDINYMRITDSGLTFPYYAGSGIGRAVRLDTSGPDGAAQFFSYGGITTGTLFFSFMLNVFSASPSGNYFTGILPFTLNPPYGKVYVKDSSGYLAFGVSKSSEAPHYTRAEYLKDVTYLVVLKYEFQPGTNDDLVSLFVFASPPPIAEPVPNAGPSGSGNTDIPGAFAFALFQCYGGNYPGAVFDGIYVDEYWNNFVLPVELTNFTANTLNADVTLHWSTSREHNNSGFNIERKLISENNWLNVGNVKGSGTLNEPKQYKFTDYNLCPGSYIYRLKQIDFNGNFEYFDLSEAVAIGVPDEFSLEQNYPNPFNPVTTIAFGIPQAGNVKLKVFDMSGREIKTLINEYKDAGYYVAKFYGSSFASGTYICRLEFENYISAKKMVLLK
jgi:hypothetical protein